MNYWLDKKKQEEEKYKKNNSKYYIVNSFPKQWKIVGKKNNKKIHI